MIGTRIGAALALALSVAAVALGAAALMTALRDDDQEQGRLVQTRLVPSESAPVLFPLDEFYASTGEDGVLRALYLYPPGFYGHNRGCHIVWAADALGLPQAQEPGAFLDPCGGARFARDGTLIDGDAARGLDRFKTEPGIEGIIVDTRTLYCWRSVRDAADGDPVVDRHVGGAGCDGASRSLSDTNDGHTHDDAGPGAVSDGDERSARDVRRV